MNTISEEYRKLNTQLHEERPDYGAGSWRPFAQMIIEMCKSLNTNDILDYGCGKGGLAMALPMADVTNYDPAIEKWSAEPEPHDVVVCTDVAEHVEPEFTNAFLDDLVRVTKRTLILTVNTGLAVKELQDGRNAHINIKEPIEWLFELTDRFELISYNKTSGAQFLCVLQPKQ
jgi:2-polyprenyl-3-methyl-5-hydroxy-6-metoxy-1,4-benzoquinol methylase